MQATDLSKRMTLAAAEDTDTEVLQQLATDIELEVRQAVASNPNTDTDTLLKLGEEFPDRITANPIFLIKLLVEPESRFVRLSLARSSTTSANTFANLSDMPDEEVICAMAQNPATPPAILEKLVRQPPKFENSSRRNAAKYTRLFSIIAKNQNTPVAALTYLNQVRSGHNNLDVALAEHPNTSPQILAELANLSRLEVHQALLRNPKLPVSILEMLAGEEDKDIRLVIKNHPNVSHNAKLICDFVEGKSGITVDVLDKLAEDRRSHLRRLVAEYPKTPQSVLRKLVIDSEAKNRFVLLRHPNLPGDVLEKLARQFVTQYKTGDRSCISALLAIAEHDKATADILKNLVDVIDLNNYEVHKVVEAIAKHLQTSSTIFIKFARYVQDKPDLLAIHKALASNPNLPPEALEIIIWGLLLCDRPIGVAGYYLTHPRVPPACLEKLATHQSHSIRAAVARNPSLPLYFLEWLANNRRYEISHLVAANPQAPLELLHKFMLDPDPWVRRGVAQNPNLPPEAIAILVSDEDPIVRAEIAKHPNISLEIIDLLALDPSYRVRYSLVENIKTPTRILNELADCPEARIRFQVLEHPHVSVDIAIVLSGDPDFMVAQRASQILGSSRQLSTNAIGDLAESTFARIYAKINNHRDVKNEYLVLEWLVKQPKTPDWVLELLASNEPSELYELFGESWFSHLRVSVAKNLNAPVPLLQKLSSDGELGRNGVREAAMMTLNSIGSDVRVVWEFFFNG